MRWIYPRKLYHQIAVLISVVIVAVFFTFGSLAAKKQTQFLKSIMTENAMRMTQALSESCIRYLLISDYAGLDELLKKFIIMSDSLQIRVHREDGKVLSEVSKESGTSSPVRSVGKITTQVPEGATTQIVVSDGRMIIWQPVVSIKVIGWVRIAYSLKNINDMHRDIWIATGKAAMFWTLLSITLFMLVLNPLARAIRRLSDFARQLGSHKGEQINIRQSSYEIQQLCQALNDASVDLYTKEKEVTSYRDHLEEMVATRTVELQKEIFERRKVEQILKESEERLRTLINSTPDIVCFKDGEGRWLEANEADLELFQLNGVHYRGKKDSELAEFSDFYREVLLSCEVTDERAWQAQAPTREDETIPRPDGTVKIIDVIKVPLFHKDKKRKGLVVLGRDITERIQAETALKSAQKQLLALFDGIEDIIYVSDIETHELLYTNEAFKKQWGNDSIGKKCYTIIQNMESPCPFCTNESISDRNFGNALVWEHRNQATLRWYRCADKAIRWHDGRVVRFELAIDITDRKRVESERLHLEQRLYQLQKAESLGLMAGAIAHHFNNQLSVVIGNLEIALEDIPQDSEALANISESMKASHRAAEMSQMMLKYLGQTTGRKERLNLLEVIRETLPILGSLIPQTVHLKTELPNHGAIILADAAHIKDIITNLVTNAVEAITENEGFITMSMQVVASLDVQGLQVFPLDWKPKANSYACLAISDTGCGINAPTLEKIFDPFFSSKFTGRGLGLSVILGLVGSYDGAIGVESQPDQGTVFRIFFPLEKDL